MIRTLDRAIAELVGPIPGLRAAVLSVAPDSLIAWCWTRHDEPEVALNFARLDRAATVCLEALGASQQGRSMLLSAQDTWIAVWPLEEADPNDDRLRARLVLTTVFSGDLQSGMVMVYGRRVVQHLRAAWAKTQASGEQLREQLADLVLKADEPGVALERVAAGTAIELRRLERVEVLSDEEQQRLGREAERSMRGR